MRVAGALIAIVGCAPSVRPETTLAVGGFTVTAERAQIDASIGAVVTLRTGWAESCEVEGWRYHERRSETCNEVKHRIRVRCLEGCTIRSDGRTFDDEAELPPSLTNLRTFDIVPKARSLALEVTFTHGRDVVVEHPPAIRFVAPTELVIECGKEVFADCMRVFPTDGSLVVRVREATGMALGEVRVNGVLAPYGHIELRRAVPSALGTRADGSSYVRRGDYPIVVETDAIRRELTLTLR